MVELQGQHHWKLVLTELLEQERISFTYQPIQPMHRSMLAYNEIYTRFSSADGTVLPTDTLFAMAQRLDMVMRLEQMLVTHVMRQYRAFGSNQSRWGINLSSNLLQNSAFLIWLDRQLLNDPNTSANLVFELDEEHLERNLTGAKRVFELLRRNGSRSAICNFGKGIGSFNLFRELKPDYIKLDPALITGLEQDLTNQQFVRMIVDVSHRMGCQVIAEGVEQLGQKQLLQGMYVDGLQAISSPSPSSCDQISASSGCLLRMLQLQQSQNDVVELAITLQLLLIVTGRQGGGIVAILEVTVDLQPVETRHLIDLPQQRIELFVLKTGLGEVILLSRALQLAALLGDAAGLLQIAEPLLQIERLAARQQIEEAHRIAAAVGQQQHRQLIVIAAEGDGAALPPVQRLNPDLGSRPCNAGDVEYKHGSSRSAKG